MDRALSARLDAPFWFDTTRYPAYVDIRVQQPQGVLRVSVEVVAASDMTWVALSDPIPGGATILGSGRGRESQIATQGEMARTVYRAGADGDGHAADRLDRGDNAVARLDRADALRRAREDPAEPGKLGRRIHNLAQRDWTEAEFNRYSRACGGWRPGSCS